MVQAAIVKSLTELATDETGALENLKLLIEAGMQEDASDESAALRLKILEQTSAMLELVAANTASQVCFQVVQKSLIPMTILPRSEVSPDYVRMMILLLQENMRTTQVFRFRPFLQLGRQK